MSSGTHSISIDQYPSSLAAEIELEDNQPTHSNAAARVNMDSDAERSIASSDHPNDDPHISANADAVVESDVDQEPREEGDDVDAVFDLNQDSHGGAEDAEFDLDDDDEDIFQDDNDDDDVFDLLTGTRRRSQVYGEALDGERRIREVYGDELDGGMGRAVGDDLREAVYGVAWDGEAGRGDAHWQEEENFGAVASSSSSDEVTDAEDDIGVECKGVEGVDSGTDGLSCPICMYPLSREGKHIAWFTSLRHLD